MIGPEPSADRFGTYTVQLGIWYVGLRVYLRAFTDAVGRPRDTITAVAYDAYGKIEIATLARYLLPLVQEKYGRRDVVIVMHVPRHSPALTGRDERGRRIFRQGEHFFQVFDRGNGEPRSLLEFREIDRRAVEYFTGHPWLPVVEGVSIDELRAEREAERAREARMLDGDRNLIEIMRSRLTERGHDLLHATAYPEKWFYSESRDRRGRTYVASGESAREWLDDFSGVSACPEFPPAVGSGMSILHAKKPQAVTVRAIEEDGAILVVTEDRAVRVDGGVGDAAGAASGIVPADAIYRYEPAEASLFHRAIWDERRGAWLVAIMGELLPLGHGRRARY